MIIIAHRGNLSGPNPELENRPDYLFKAMEEGFDVEIDLWVINGKPFFGHDEPKHDITDAQIVMFKKRGWFHCKNINALSYMIKYHSDANFFFHESDKATLTSHGYIWTYPHPDVTDDSVVVLPEIYGDELGSAYAVCTDFCIKK
jgi:hypothetical protein